MTTSSSRRAEIASVPPCGIACTPLSTTLRIACFMKSVSTLTDNGSGGNSRVSATLCCAASGAASVATSSSNSRKSASSKCRSRAREVHQNLHHAIQAVNLVANNIHVPKRIGVSLLKLVLQQLQMQHDGINRILHFVCDSAGQPPA